MMAQKGRGLRPEFSPWVAVSVMGEIVADIDHGFADLHDDNISLRTRTIILGGILERLHSVVETLYVLVEAVPSLGDICDSNRASFARWQRFRDDSAHIADRILRRSGQGRHEAGFQPEGASEPRLYTAQALMYNRETNEVRTGAHRDQSMNLREEVERVQALYDNVSIRMSYETNAGRVHKPKGYKDPIRPISEM